MSSVIRRSKGFSHPALHVGELELNQASHCVNFAGSPVDLTRKEFAILELMMLRKGMSLSKSAFLDHLYGGIDEPDAKIIASSSASCARSWRARVATTN